MKFTSANHFKNFLSENYNIMIALTAMSVFTKLQPVASSDNKLANAIIHKLNKNVIAEDELEVSVLGII